jgi:multimeric flavodoxin WrbA
MADVVVRKDMPPVKLDREEFARRYRNLFADPAFEPLQVEVQRITEAAWDAYANSRKSPHTRRAGEGYTDPDYELSTEWIAARDAIIAAERIHKDPTAPSNILIINGATRSEHTCPSETSKTFRLASLARNTIQAEPEVDVTFLDLSRLASEYGRMIFPCKTCVSTAMPLCHWPCSCYPNHALGQVNDWMNEIFPMWVRAHGIMILSPVNWLHTSSTLKLMIDRLVCADGGNTDPTSTHGKKAEEAKALELQGWPYPRHLAGRASSVVVHGDAEGVTGLQESLAAWLSNMGLIAAGTKSQVGAYIGYMQPYATSHEDLDRDAAMQEEVRNAARSLIEAVQMLRRGELKEPGARLREPRPK